MSTLQQSATSDAVRPSARRLRRVLIADDDEDFRALLVAVLRRRGFLVDSVSDGTEFTELVAAATEEDLPDVVVSDVRMPGYTGLELLSIVRHAGWRVPVILVSGFADDELRDDALDQQAFAVLDKPCPMESIANTVEAAAAQVDEWDPPPSGEEE